MDSQNYKERLTALGKWSGCELTVQEAEQLCALDWKFVQHCVSDYEDVWKRYEDTALVEAERKKVWHKTKKASDLPPEEIDHKPLKALLDVRVAVKKDKEEKPYAVQIPMEYIPLITDLLKKEKERVLTEFDEAHKPKPDQPKKTGTRKKFNGTPKYQNTKEDPQDKDAKYYFVGDEDAVFEKITYTAPDGSFQNKHYKAVKSNRYLV